MYFLHQRRADGLANFAVGSAAMGGGGDDVEPAKRNCAAAMGMRCPPLRPPLGLMTLWGHSGDVNVGQSMRPHKLTCSFLEVNKNGSRGSSSGRRWLWGCLHLHRRVAILS